MNSMFPGMSVIRKKRSLTTILCVAIVLLLATVGVLFWKYQDAKGSANQAQETSDRIIGKVSALYMVPSNEEPTVAQIQDKAKLGNQEFFKTSQNGDYLLIYQKTKVALVYREDINKLITVGPISVGDDKNSDPAQEGQTAGAQTEQTTETGTNP